jgi:hypothetical protein
MHERCFCRLSVGSSNSCALEKEGGRFARIHNIIPGPQVHDTFARNGTPRFRLGLSSQQVSCSPRNPISSSMPFPRLPLVQITFDVDDRHVYIQ